MRLYMCACERCGKEVPATLKAEYDDGTVEWEER